MSEYRVAKLEALLARVLERKNEPRVIAAAVAEDTTALEPAATSSVPATQLEHAHVAATTPPPPPVAVPAVSIPRQPRSGIDVASNDDDAQESTHVSRSSGPALVPIAAESHARISTAARSGATDDTAKATPELEEERAPVSSERTVDPSLEADPDSAQAPPESTRQLATSPPPQTTPPRISSPPSIAPESAPRSVGNPVITRGSLPPDAHDAVEFRGELPAVKGRLVGDLLDATLLI